jgi:hypothetical protein
MDYFYFKFKDQKFFVQSPSDFVTRTLFVINEHGGDMLLLYLKTKKTIILINL